MVRNHHPGRSMEELMEVSLSLKSTQNWEAGFLAILTDDYTIKRTQNFPQRSQKYQAFTLVAFHSLLPP